MRIGDGLINRGTSSTISTATPTTAATDVSSEREAGESSDYKKGDVIEGKVVSKDAEGNVTLKTSEGKDLKIKLTTPEGSSALVVGKNIQIQLEEVTPAAKFGRLMTSNANREAVLDSAVDQMIQRFGETPGEGSRQVVKAMVQFDIPLTKENFKALQNEGKYTQKLADLLSKSPELGHSVDMTSQVKNILIKLLSAASTPSPQNEALMNNAAVEGNLSEALVDESSGHMTTPNTNGSGSSKASLSVEPATNPLLAEIKKTEGVVSSPSMANLVSNDATGKVPLQNQTTGRPLQSEGVIKTENMNAENLETLQVEQLQAGDVEIPAADAPKIETPKVLEPDGKTVKTEILQSLKDHGVDKTAFFKKMNLDTTLSNIVTFNRLMINKQSMLGAFEKILTNMKDVGMIEDGDVRQLLTKLAGLEHTDLEEHANVLQQLIEKVNALEASSGAPIKHMSEPLMQLQSDFDFIKHIHENLVYYQMPMHYEEGTGQLEIAYKKRKKDPSEGHKIFISLDTKNIGQVQALVEMKGRTVKIDFRVDDSALKQKFENAFDELKQAISKSISPEDSTVGYQIELGFVVRQSPLSAMDLFKEEVPHLSAFDLSI